MYGKRICTIPLGLNWKGILLNLYALLPLLGGLLDAYKHIGHEKGLNLVPLGSPKLSWDLLGYNVQ